MHVDTIDAKGRQYFRGVGDQPFARRDDHHAFASELLGALVVEEREAMETDGGLAASGTALDDHEPRVCSRNQVELPGVEQCRYFGQVTIDSLLTVGPYTELTSRLGIARTRCLALTTRQIHLARRYPTVVLLSTTNECVLWTSDSVQQTFVDRHRASHEQLFFNVAITESLLVGVTFCISVVDLVDRGMALIHDANVRGRINVRGATDEDVAITCTVLVGFAEGEVSEVRVVGVDEACAHFVALSADAGQSFHLGKQGGYVFHSRFGNLVPQREKLRIVGLKLLGGRASCSEVGDNACEQCLFLFWDETTGRIGWAVGERAGLCVARRGAKVRAGCFGSHAGHGGWQGGRAYNDLRECAIVSRCMCDGRKSLDTSRRCARRCESSGAIWSRRG